MFSFNRFIIVRTGAAFLLVVLMALQVYKDIHRYHHLRSTMIINATGKQADSKSPVVSLKCAVCDLICHQHSQQFLLLSDSFSCVLTETAFQFSQVPGCCSNSGYVHLSGNKGPPAVASLHFSIS